MITEKNITHVVDLPISEFGTISKDKLVIGGQYIINDGNKGEWALALQEFEKHLISLGLKETQVFSFVEIDDTQGM